MLANCVLFVDNMENCKPMKASPERRIDGIITTLMCIKQYIEQE